MKSYSSSDVIKMMKAAGWYEVDCVGDHHHFRHADRKEKVTVTHPKKDMPIGTIKAISRQTGIKFE